MTSTNPVSTALCRCLRWWILYSVHNHNDVNQPCLQCTLQVYSLVDSVHTALNSTQRTCSKGASLLKWFYPLIYRNYIFPMWAEIIFYNFLNFFLFPFVKSFRCKRFIQTACLDVHPPPLQPLSSTHSTFKDNPWPNVPGIIPELTTPTQSEQTIVIVNTYYDVYQPCQDLVQCTNCLINKRANLRKSKKCYSPESALWLWQGIKL